MREQSLMALLPFLLHTYMTKEANHANILLIL